MIHKDRHIHQWNSTESPDITPYIYGQLTFKQGQVFQQSARTTAFSYTKEETHTIHKNKLKLDQ